MGTFGMDSVLNIHYAHCTRWIFLTHKVERQRHKQCLKQVVQDPFDPLLTHYPRYNFPKSLKWGNSGTDIAMYGAGIEMRAGVCVVPKRGEKMSKTGFPSASGKKTHAKYGNITSLSWSFGFYQFFLVYDTYSNVAVGSEHLKWWPLFSKDVKYHPNKCPLLSNLCV